MEGKDVTRDSISFWVQTIDEIKTQMAKNLRKKDLSKNTLLVYETRGYGYDYSKEELIIADLIPLPR